MRVDARAVGEPMRTLCPPYEIGLRSGQASPPLFLAARGTPASTLLPNREERSADPLPTIACFLRFSQNPINIGIIAIVLSPPFAYFSSLSRPEMGAKLGARHCALGTDSPPQRSQTRPSPESISTVAA